MIEYLEWDSNFFGFPVGKVSYKSFNGDLFSDNLRYASKHGYKCLYIFLSELSPLEAAQIENSGAKLVDEKITFRKTVPDSKYFPTIQIIPYTGLINQTLKDLAIESGKYSRFKTDKLFCIKFKELYETWMSNSLNKKIADETLVAIVNDKIVGMVTLKDTGNIGRIGIIAVNPQFQGQKIGTSLIIAADNWYFEHGLYIAEVISQKANKTACEFYLKNNYTVQKIEYIFHYHFN